MVELQSTLGPSLASKGYKLVLSGPSGVTWRRERDTKVWVGVVVLALLALGSFGTGKVGNIIAGLVFGAAAVALFLWRRSATVSVGFRPGLTGGSDITIDGAHAEHVTGIVKMTAAVTDG